MKVSLDWLKDFIAIKSDMQTLVSELTVRSVEVDEVIDFSETLKKIVVGQIKKIENHPNADRLKICHVDVGRALVKREADTPNSKKDSKELKIICGGWNIEEGAKVAVALPGALVRWHGEGELVTLQPTAIRGVESFGMICAPEEIGFMKGREGEIMILGQDARLGADLVEALGLTNGVLDLDVLANRADLMGHFGVAREISAVFDWEFKAEHFELPKKTGNDLHLDISLKNKNLSARYSGILVSGVEIAPSPDWLKYRLIGIGLRPINNIVDLTNYIMHDLGQPLHAFDYDKLAKGKMVVRESKEGEVVTTLDGQDRLLPTGTIIIEDAEKIIDLAGIMGGANSGIDDTSKNIFIQAAVFDPIAIRRASRELGHRTDAVARYEKGVDETATLSVLGKTLALLHKMMPDAVLEEVVDIISQKSEHKPIAFSKNAVAKLTGIKIPLSEQKNILSRLGCKVTMETGNFSVLPPSWRKDLRVSEDFVEEIVRIHGYHAFGDDLPKITLAEHAEDPKIFWARLVCDALTMQGMSEVMNYSFIPTTWVEQLGLEMKHHITVQNPMSADQNVMRSELLTSLFKNVSKNSRHSESVKIFELANVFSKKGAVPREALQLSGVLWGEELTFYDGKGIVESVMQTMNIHHYEFLMSKGDDVTINAVSMAGRALHVVVDGVVVGSVGAARAELTEYFDINSEVYWFDLEFEKLISYGEKIREYKPVSKYPSIYLDLAIVVDNTITWKSIEQFVRKEGGKILRNIELFDVYTGKQIQDSKKSMAFHLEFYNEHKTLTLEEVNPKFEKIQKSLKKSIGAEIRAV